MNEATFVSREREGGVLVLTLQRPEKLNAWHKPMRDELAAALRSAGDDRSVAAVVLTGAGDRAFCAGADIGELAERGTEAEVRAGLRTWRDFYAAIREFEKPLVVGLNGLAAGSGFQVALLADMRIGYPGVRMGQTEIKSGIPSITGSLIMAQRIGTARAREMALSARMINAEEAAGLGLLDKIVTQPQVRAEAIAAARALGSFSPTATGLTKRWFCQYEQAALDVAFDFAEAAQVTAFRDGDMAEGTRQFMARKKESRHK